MPRPPRWSRTAWPLLARIVEDHGGQVVKTLGDGLMAVFDAPAAGGAAADEMHESLERIGSRGSERGASPACARCRLQVALARGEVVEMAGDCFGDAVNVAARLLDHAGDNETLVTAPVLDRPGAREQRALSQPRPHAAARPRRAGARAPARRRGAAATPRPRSSATSRRPPSPKASACVWLDLNRVFASRQPAGGAGPQPAGAPTASTTRACRARMRASTGTAAPSSSPTSATTAPTCASTTTARSSACAAAAAPCTAAASSAWARRRPIRRRACVRFEVLRFGDTESRRWP